MQILESAKAYYRTNAHFLKCVIVYYKATRKKNYELA
jgi:hypothetical protein